MQAYKKRGFWIGLAAFFFIILTPNPYSLSPIGWAVAAVTLLMAIWWATEAVPVAVTALLPLALFPMLHVTDFKTAAMPYANPNIYLFMGGFILALGIESSGLHKRLALKMLIAIGNSGAKLVGGFMLVSASISMWVMNTSTTLMLLPIGLAVCASVAETIPNFSAKEKKNFETSLLLGIAYAASIGGMSTLVGTAPNIIFVGFIQETYGIEISFIDWMKLGVPLAILMLGASWYAITKIVYPVNFIASMETKLQLQNMLTDLGPLGRDEKKVLIIFSLAAGAWMFRTLLDNFVPLSGLTDAGIAIFAALSFFFIPSENGKTDLLTFLTEITSNVATTSTFLPVVGAVAVALGIAPVALTIPVVLAASCAFMLPVATPPNAIVFGSGKLTIPDMMRAGFALNIIGVFLVTLFAFYLAPMIF